MDNNHKSHIPHDSPVLIRPTRVTIMSVASITHMFRLACAGNDMYREGMGGGIKEILVRYK